MANYARIENDTLMEIYDLIPENWKNKYNIRWTKRIQIEPSVKNTSKIILQKAPVAFVSEVLTE